jgi:hypothetical protein
MVQTNTGRVVVEAKNVVSGHDKTVPMKPAHHTTRTIPRNGTAKRRSPEMYSCFSTSVSQQTIARSVQFPVPQKM